MYAKSFVKEIAEKLLSSIAKEALKNDAVWLRFSVLKSDKNAIDLYETLGAQDVTAMYDYHIWSFDQNSLKQIVNSLK